MALNLKLGGRPSHVSDYAWYSTNLTLAPPPPAPSVRLGTWTCAAERRGEESWTRTTLSGDVFTLALGNASAPLCLTMLKAGPEGGRNTTALPCMTPPPINQRWTAVCKLNTTGPAPHCLSYHIISAESAPVPWCLDIKDGVTSQGATVFSYACHSATSGEGQNQFWELGDSPGAVVSKLDGLCLGLAPEGAAGRIRAMLHESTLAHVFVDGEFTGTLNNEQ